MFFLQYYSEILRLKKALKLPGYARELFLLEPTVNSNAPPWRLDWCIFFEDGKHLRMKEYFRSKPHPDYMQGTRVTFSYQYGETTGTDSRGWPRTANDKETIIRIDVDDEWGPHLNYNRRNHILQQDLEGSFRIEEMTVEKFLDAVNTHMSSNGCPFQDILFFKVKERR